MVRRNYKVSENIGFSRGSIRWFKNSSIQDKGLVSSGRVSYPSLWEKIKPTDDKVLIGDANNRSVHAEGTIDIFFYIVGPWRTSISTFENK